MPELVPEAKKSIAFSEALISTAGLAYLIVLFVAGFLTNFVPTGTVNTGTVLLYSLASFLSGMGLLYLFNPLPKHIATAAFTTLSLSALTVLKAALDTNPIIQRIQESAIFFLGAWPLLFFIQIDSPKVRGRLLKTLATGLVGLSTFAIFQGIFANSLPLSLFALRGDNPFGVGDDQFRPTGLTGNPIIFSSILVFASAFFAALWLEKRRSKFLLALICSLVANYLTYTRASIVLVIPVLVLVWLFHKRFRIKHKILAIIAVILALAVGEILLIIGTNLLIVQRLQTSNAESLESTLIHFRQIEDSRDAIAAHPLLGTGMGSQGSSLGPENVIITDGTWWILFLEFGMPLSILIIILLLLTLLTISKYVMHTQSKNRALAIATLSFHAYILPSSFINSALLGHISFGLYWVVLGLSLAGTGSVTLFDPTFRRVRPQAVIVARHL